MQLRKLLAQRECAGSFALFDHFSGAHGRPDPHKQVDMVRLDRQFQDRPALLVALLANQLVAPLATLVHQHLFPALGAPDELVDHQMHVLFVALVVQVAPVVSPAENLPP